MWVTGEWPDDGFQSFVLANELLTEKGGDWANGWTEHLPVAFTGGLEFTPEDTVVIGVIRGCDIPLKGKVHSGRRLANSFFCFRIDGDGSRRGQCPTVTLRIYHRRAARHATLPPAVGQRRIEPSWGGDRVPRYVKDETMATLGSRCKTGTHGAYALRRSFSHHVVGCGGMPEREFRGEGRREAE